MTCHLIHIVYTEGRVPTVEPSVQRSAEVDAPGLVISVPAVASHSYPNLPATFTQPEALNLVNLCTYRTDFFLYNSIITSEMESQTT